MIRINLLPTRQAKKKEMGRQQLVLFAVAIVLAIVLNYVWYANVDGELTSKRSQVAKLEDDIKQLERIIGEVTTITKDKKALEDKLAVLAELRKGRSGPVKMLDALATSMPKRVWITSLSESNRSLTLLGGALSNEDLADLMRELKKSPFFQEPSLKRAVQRDNKEKGIRYIEFELTCGINYAA